MKGGRAKPNLRPAPGTLLSKRRESAGSSRCYYCTVFPIGMGWHMDDGRRTPNGSTLLWKEELLSFQAPSPGTRGAPQAHRGFPPPSTSCCSSTAEAAHKPHIQGICSAVSTRHVHDGHACCLMKGMINAVKTQCDHGQIGFPH